MSEVKNRLSIATGIDAVEKDVIPQGRFTVESGVYPVILDLAYFNFSAGGAQGLTLHFKIGNTDQIIKETLWLTSGDAKGNRNTFVNAKGKEQLLPGMAQGEALAQLLTGKSIADAATEDKVVKLWDFASRSELPTKVAALTELIGQELVIGVVLKVENKNVKNADGAYEPTNDKREFNETTKFFHADGRTASEKLAGQEDPEFIEAWKAKFAGKTINKFKPVAGAPVAGTPVVGSPTKPLFT